MMRRRPLFCIVLLFLLIIPIPSTSALYEDQVGKFDWRIQQLGCFHQVELGRTLDGDEFLVVSSTSNAIGRINLNSGELVWRQLNEASTTGHHPSISIEGSRVVALLNGGEYLRTFDLKTGALKWQQRLGLSAPRMAVSKAAVVLLVDKSKVLGLLGRDKVNSRWTADLGDSETEWRQIYLDGDQDTAYVVGYNRNRKEAMVARIGLKLGGIEKIDRWPTKSITSAADLEKCVLQQGLLICPKSANQLSVVDVSTSSPPREIEGHVAVDGAITKLGALPTQTHGRLMAHTDSGGVVLIHTDGNAFELGLNAGNPSAYALSSRHLLVYDEVSQQLKLFEIGATGQPPELYPTKGTVLDENNKLAPVRSIHLLDSSPTAAEGSKQVLVVREDCRVDFLELTSTSANAQANLEWTRHESLSSISVVKMIDLPLSEAQARIETEFSLADAPMWKCFLMRVKSQVEQMKHSLVSFANRLVESMELLVSGRQSSVSAFVNNLLGYRQKHAPREEHRTQGSSSAPLERDYFNLDKIIIASTLSGSVHGINSENGEVVWSLYLGADAVPFEEQLGRAKFPLHIQRDTSHAHYESQAAIVFKSLKTGHGVVVVFNPVTGALIDRLQIADLRRVELLPFSDSQKLRPLLLLQGAEESTVEADIYPREAYIPTYPVHLVEFLGEFFANGRTMRGLSVNVGERKVAENWKTLIADGDAKVVAIAGKPIDEKVHSQGKVLGDRSVLYKYSNPNLIAIASLDRDKSSLLTITLVDGVSGQIIHRAHHPNSAEPVHLVHCENWAAYSFWNEKARRTELGVIELYEGAEQNNPEQFNSYAALKNPPVVHTQSYLFSQGISAMAVTDTERGLTTRALLIAMPFGGVLEISRRFVDARRPLEMTPEMREEMIIPYMPELPIATEDLINYNQTVHQIRGIKTASSGLESTGLVFAYGLDLFYTRVTPSGTFDILKDDFDYPLISVVMIALVVASVACKKLWRHNKLKQAWS